MGIANPTQLVRAPCAVWLLVFSAACTTLGPTPAMTGVPVTPAARTSFELQAAAIPGYYLSTTVLENPKGATLPQLLGLLEPDSLIGVPGLFAGARYAGESDSGGALEPLLGYRTFLDDDQRFALAATGFLAYASASQSGASFSALRGGLEAAVDTCLTGRSQYAELHTHLGLTLTGLDVDGSYCVDPDGFGQDCPSDPSTTPAMKVSGGIGGIFPSAHLGASVDFARHIKIAFHGVRLAADLSGGALPTVLRGQQRGVKLFGAAGLSLTVGIGKSE